MLSNFESFLLFNFKKKLTVLRNYFMNTPDQSVKQFGTSDPDHAHRFVGPNLSQNFANLCYQQTSKVAKGKERILSVFNSRLQKRVCIGKLFLVISLSKHMLFVLKRTVSVRLFF